jgi:predicted HTH transcriptional regulator
LVFKNEGLFIPKDIKTVIHSDAPNTKNRNPFLLNAMFNLNMIDTIGSGIKRMFTIQKKRLFPLPEYTINDTAVSVNIYGEVLSKNYAEYLSKHQDITLEQTIILDKVQKDNPLNDEELEYLKSINYSTKTDKVKLESNQVSDQVSDQENSLVINTLQDINTFLNLLSQSDSDQVSDQVSNQVIQLLNKEFKNKLISILSYIKDEAKLKSEILTHIGLSNHTINKRRYIDPLLKYNWIEYTIPENIKDRNQRYKLTKTGLTLLEILKS